MLVPTTFLWKIKHNLLSQNTHLNYDMGQHKFTKKIIVYTQIIVTVHVQVKTMT